MTNIFKTHFLAFIACWLCSIPVAMAYEITAKEFDGQKHSYTLTLHEKDLVLKYSNKVILSISKNNLTFKPKLTKEAPNPVHVKYNMPTGTLSLSTPTSSLDVSDISINQYPAMSEYPFHIEIKGKSLALNKISSEGVHILYTQKGQENDSPYLNFNPSITRYYNKNMGNKDIITDTFSPEATSILISFTKYNNFENHYHQIRALIDLKIFEHIQLEKHESNDKSSLASSALPEAQTKDTLSSQSHKAIKINTDKDITFKSLKGYQSILPILQNYKEVLIKLNENNKNHSNNQLYPNGYIIDSTMGNYSGDILKALSNESGTCLITINDLNQLYSGILEAKEYSKKNGSCFLLIDIMDNYRRLFQGVDMEALISLLKELDELDFEKKSGKNLHEYTLIPVLVFEDWQTYDELNTKMIGFQNLSLFKNNRFVNKIRIENPSNVEREDTIKNLLSINNLSIEGDLNEVINKTAGWSRDIIKSFIKDMQLQSKARGSNVLNSKIIDESYHNLLSHKKSLDNSKEQSFFEKLSPVDNKLNFKKLRGMSESKKAFDQIIAYLKNPSSFEYLGGEPPKGMILYGPPGTGKTTLVRALAGETSTCVISASGSQFEEKYIGVGAERIRRLFKEARDSAPCIIFIDELDALAGPRNSGGDDSQFNVQSLNQLLAEMDGLDKNKNQGIFVIGATNFLKNIDPALLRPGRLERHVMVGLPNAEDRKDILQGLIEGKPFDKSISITQYVDKTNGWSNADLSALINNAILNATIENKKLVQVADIEKAYKDVWKNVNNTRSQIFDFTSSDNINIGFKDIIGATEAKEKLNDIKMYLDDPDKFLSLGATPPKGVILYGPPGTGKTSLAKALAKETNACFIATTGSDFFRKKDISQMKEMVEELFTVARDAQPCIIFIDEIEAVVPTRENASNSLEPIVNEFLTQMDGLMTQKNHNVIIIGATNYLNKIDKAVLRPGRLDRRIEIKLPNMEERLALVEHFSKKLKHDTLDVKKIADFTAGYSPAAIENLLNESALEAAKLGKNKVDTITVEKTFDKVNKDIRKLSTMEAPQDGIGDSPFNFLTSSQLDMTFKDVAGMKDAKDELKDFIHYIKDPKDFERLGATAPKGVLLYGPPGTGKTTLARALAGEVKTCFISVSGSQFNEKYVGVGAARIRKLFELARDAAPCIIFIDELDALAPNRFTQFSSQENTNTVNQLLAEMDGIDKSKNEQVYVIGATNDFENIDPAILRPGRLDRHINVDLPSKEDRAELFTMLLKKIKVSSDVNISTLVKMSSGWSNASIANWVNEATIYATKNGKSDVSMKDFTQSKHRIELGVNVVGTPSKEELTRTAYHEAGHALVYLLENLDNKQNINIESLTISPRGHTLGVTMYNQDEEKNFVTKSEMMMQIAMAMGGRAAEELVYGKEEISGGASSDLQYATDIARQMVTQLGHSDIGLMVLYPDENKKEVTKTINLILDERYQFSLKLLKENKTVLDEVVKQLLDKETLSQDEILDIVKKHAKTRKNVKPSPIGS